MVSSISSYARREDTDIQRETENIIVKNQGTIFLAGPPLVKAALFEVVDSETLGGGLMHATESGVVDHLADSDSHALSIARSAVASLSYRPLDYVSTAATPLPGKIDEPIHSVDDLGGIVGTDLKKTFDMREIIGRVVDGSRFHEWKEKFGPTVVTGFGSFFANSRSSAHADYVYSCYRSSYSWLSRWNCASS